MVQVLVAMESARFFCSYLAEKLTAVEKWCDDGEMNHAKRLLGSGILLLSACGGSTPFQSARSRAVITRQPDAVLVTSCGVERRELIQ